MGMIDDLMDKFKQANILLRLIYINVLVFVAVNLISLVYFLFTKDSLEPFFNNFLAIPSNILVFLHKPWTLVTYMFMHAGIWHILFNLLLLYWFGQIFLQYLNQKQLLSVYVLGGFAGAILYLLAYNLFPAFELERFGSTMVGASAAIMAVVIAISALVPDYRINFLLLGSVKLKYIAIVYVIIDVISIQYSNAGGHIAHLGGALFGYMFASRWQKGKDVTFKFSSFLEWVFSLFKRKKKMKVTYKRPVTDYEYNQSKVDQQKELDRILDKIAKGGYQSLSKDEKDFLFKSGKS